MNQHFEASEQDGTVSVRVEADGQVHIVTMTKEEFEVMQRRHAMMRSINSPSQPSGSSLTGD